jgi:hypothetical protein
MDSTRILTDQAMPPLAFEVNSVWCLDHASTPFGAPSPLDKNANVGGRRRVTAHRPRNQPTRLLDQSKILPAYSDLWYAMNCRSLRRDRCRFFQA